MPTREEIAWLAGIFEGEGHCRIQIVKNRPYPQVIVDMTDEDIIRRLHSVSGVGRIKGPFQPKPPAKKPRWTWYVTRGVDAKAFLEAILPWMGDRRINQIENVLQQIQTTSYNREMPPSLFKVNV